MTEAKPGESVPGSRGVSSLGAGTSESHDLADAIIATVPDPLLVLDGKLSAVLVEVAEPPKYTLEAQTKERLRELEIENATLLKILGK